MTGVHEVSQRGIGRNLTDLCQNDSLGIGQRTPLCRSVKVRLAYRKIAIMTKEDSAGARACLGRRYELLQFNLLAEQSPHRILFCQVLRDRGHSHHDHARVKI